MGTDSRNSGKIAGERVCSAFSIGYDICELVVLTGVAETGEGFATCRCVETCAALCCRPKPCHGDFNTADMIGHSSAVVEARFYMTVSKVATKQSSESPWRVLTCTAAGAWEAMVD
jgi:hypothetical protein